MKKILLIHQDEIQHYRVSIYNYLSGYLGKKNIELSILSGGVQKGNPHSIEFINITIILKIQNIISIIKSKKPEAIIFFVNPSNYYLFPTILFSKYCGIKTIYWGHGVDLEKRAGILKKGIYSLQHRLFDSLILYSENLKKNINKKCLSKVFIANNTLNTTLYKGMQCFDVDKIKRKYSVKTKKNIVCVGRMQRRKRIDDLLEAYSLLETKDIGLILVGPDLDGVLVGAKGENIYKLGEIYGEDVLEILSISDVFCLPGHVGLSIVDAFYFGLPLVTENVNHAPEIMYLKDGVNGFIVKEGDVEQLAKKLLTLLVDDSLREKFSQAAKNEIEVNGHIENFCHGFLQAINYERG